MISVFIAYSDVPAARNALHRVSLLLRSGKRREIFQFQPMLWRFNQLNDARWTAMALRDARLAAVLVIAMSDTSAMCQGAETWLAALASEPDGPAITALVLIGEAESWTISLQRTVQRQRSAAASRDLPPTNVVSLPKKTAVACAA